MTHVLVDLVDMPDWNPTTGARGLRSVSEGRVYLHPEWKVACRDHGAMNCVAENRTLWRCIACGAAAYAPTPI